MTPMAERADQWRFCFRMMWCGVALLVAARIIPGAMAPDVYGQAAYDIDAETWALGFISAPLLVIYGIHINGRLRFSPALRIAGYLCLLGMFVYLICSAWHSPDGFIIVAFGAFFFVPSILRYLRINILDAVVRIRNDTR